jgi:hypothetical protein
MHLETWLFPMGRIPVGRASKLRITPLAMTLSLVLAAVLLLVAIQPAAAQEVSAGITGRITDPNAASIAGASVTATSTERGTSWPTRTNEEGIYSFPRIPPGNYTVRVESKGFKTAVRKDILLEVNQRARIDFALTLGSLSESIEVTAAPPLLNTDTTSVGSVVSANQVSNTPLVTRNYIYLTLLAPGATTVNPASFNNGYRSYASGGRPYINGNREELNNFLLDGIDNNETSLNLTAYQPSPDAIQEVRTITSNAPAEFGSFAGAVVNVIIKSGTNQVHGNVFEFFRNDKLNANNWGRNYSLSPDPVTGKAPRTPTRWNQFGGTLGGPVIKNKLFYFMDYQGLRQHTPSSVTSRSQYPAAWRTGDFSSISANLYDPINLDASGSPLPFTGNQIPVSRRNIVATNLFSNTALYPLPTKTGDRDNYDQGTKSATISDQFDVKVDHKLSQRDDLNARYSWGRQDIPTYSTFPLVFPSFSTMPFQNGVVNWTRSINPTTVNEARVGINYLMYYQGYSDVGQGNIAEKLGITNGNARGSGLMKLSIGTYASDIGASSVGAASQWGNTTFHYADNLTLIRGRHMMKMGGQLLRKSMNLFFAGNYGKDGTIAFDGHFSRDRKTQVAWKEADFFLGYPSQVSRGLEGGTVGIRTSTYGLYFQDDWRVTDRLTLNLGLRWEDSTPRTEVADRQANYGLYTGKLLLAGKDGNSRALYNGYHKSFQPRVGFAWTPAMLRGKTVLRGAYTISSFMEGTGANGFLAFNPPFKYQYSGIYSSNTPAQTTDQGMTTLATPSDVYKNATLNVYDPNIRPTDAQQWSVFVEHQLPAQTVFSVGYLGQHGTHLMVPMAYAQKRLQADGTVLPSSYLSGNSALSTVSTVNGSDSNGSSTYHSLQATIRQRFNKGLEYQLNYTWAKSMTDSRGFSGESGQAAVPPAYFQNVYDRKSEWGASGQDVKHNFTGVFTYELPVGHGRKFGTSMSRVLDGVVGGWQVGGITTLRGGFPVTVTGLDVSGTVGRAARADRIGNGTGPRKVGVGNTWIDKSAFRQPSAGTFGTSGVGVLRGPGWKSLDMTISKAFTISERKRVELRGECFNLTNTPQFSAPNRSVTSATFGEVSAAQGERNVQVALKFYF